MREIRGIGSRFVRHEGLLECLNILMIDMGTTVVLDWDSVSLAYLAISGYIFYYYD